MFNIKKKEPKEIRLDLVKESIEEMSSLCWEYAFNYISSNKKLENFVSNEKIFLENSSNLANDLPSSKNMLISFISFIKSKHKKQGILIFSINAQKFFYLYKLLSGRQRKTLNDESLKHVAVLAKKLFDVYLKGAEILSGDDYEYTKPKLLVSYDDSLKWISEYNAKGVENYLIYNREIFQSNKAKFSLANFSMVLSVDHLSHFVQIIKQQKNGFKCKKNK